MKIAVVSVTNDLVSDQRVHKSCLTLEKLGFMVVLVGRKLSTSLPVADRSYGIKRFRLLFSKGFLFYAEFNLRLFFFLLFRRSNILVSNDLDTLLPNYLVSRFKGIPLVYDSHEYFTGVPELEDHPVKKSVWKWIERMIMPKLKHIITVNESIAKLFKDEYGVNVNVIRNLPLLSNTVDVITDIRNKYEISVNHKIIILQGAGINVQRGAEEAVLAMEYVEGATLLIVGSGDVLPDLKKIVTKKGLKKRVKFIPKVPFNLLRSITHSADLGLTLDKDTNINYRFSLPNKLFDYIHAGVPVLASDLPEIKKIVNEFKVGELIESHDPMHIAEKMSFMLNSPMQAEWKRNALNASKELCWQNEEGKLIRIYEKMF